MLQENFGKTWQLGNIRTPAVIAKALVVFLCDYVEIIDLPKARVLILRVYGSEDIQRCGSGETEAENWKRPYGFRS